jgi:hypothetical protein
MKSLLLLAGMLVLSGCSHKPDLTCAVIHESKQGCPQGYVREKHQRFTEKDGSREYACVSDDLAKPGCTDVLRPGETESVFIFYDNREQP